MKSFLALTKIQWFGLFRDKETLGWTLAFPIGFLLLFGFLFQEVGYSKSELGTVGDPAFISQMPSDSKQQFQELFKTESVASESEALDKLKKGDLDVVLVENGPKLTLFYSQADPIKSGNAVGTMQSFVQGANLAISKVEPVILIETKQVEDKSVKPIQLIASGLLGWAVAMGAVFGAAMPLVEWRNKHILRRLRFTPTSTLAIVASRTVISLALAFIQTVVFLAIAVLLFKFELNGAWLMVFPLVACATFAFMSFGLIAGAVSKTAEGASGISNLIVLPMAFLSGSFIPLDSAPSWLTTVSKFLPLGYLNEATVDILARGQGASAAYLAMAVLVATGIIGYLIAAKLFRWEA